MYKDATYKQKFSDLDPFLPSIVDSIKKDLKNEHLKKDPQFIKLFCSNQNINKLSADELCLAYRQALKEAERAEDLGEFMAARWLLKHSEMYEFFEKELSQLANDFTTLNEIEAKDAQQIIDKSIAEFNALDTYLFAVLNSVVFPAQHFVALKEKAVQSLKMQSTEHENQLKAAQAHKINQNWELEMARMKDKYEKKLAGLQKKYTIDIEALKKQNSALQRKLRTSAD